MRPAVIFRGKGRVPAVERAAYNPRVDVFFKRMYGWTTQRASRG